MPFADKPIPTACTKWKSALWLNIGAGKGQSFGHGTPHMLPSVTCTKAPMKITSAPKMQRVALCENGPKSSMSWSSGGTATLPQQQDQAPMQIAMMSTTSGTNPPSAREIVNESSRNTTHTDPTTPARAAMT
eukprot:CAMPEP_0115710912 /NCGR_PEP_ID=MMETSP0272-20121206/73277_1 /TAXON_ID=71861 /ORGANISM="Scrippsiella trochoidea, Strain CCMP3099" /LENGTH=131 /DNA_ID=CAMNT_0003152659 /DNA_START=236 /DNA_END=631 /DNA_ORIENTATION=+